MQLKYLETFKATTKIQAENEQEDAGMSYHT